VEDAKDTHKLIASQILTSMIMWQYVLTVGLYVDNKMLLFIGIVTSTIHLFCILLFRFKVSIDYIMHIYLGSAFIFNIGFTCSTGGIFSSSMVWPSVFPMLAGIIRGKRALLIWLLLSMSSVTFFSFLGDTGFSLINETGRTWASLNIAFGYLFLNATLILVYIKSKEHTNLLLEKRNESIHRLLKIVSHDIANPLTAMHFRLTMLKSKMDNYSDEEKKLFKDIEDSAEMMYMILEHTRRYEAIGEGLGFDNMNVNLNDVIKYAEFTFKEKLNDKSLAVRYDYEKNKSVNFKGIDIEVKNQIFNNLFSNSIKFSRDYGEISIDVRENKKSVIIVYRDTGEGIEPKVLKNMFRADVKTSKVGLEGELGSGFGMPILHQTLKSYGGSVTAVSTMRGDVTAECGSTFELTFLK
jgi:signal transduction histidine kinase